MFVKLTRLKSGAPVYINAEKVRGVEADDEKTFVYVGMQSYTVKESPETVVMLLEAAMKGGFMA